MQASKKVKVGGIILLNANKSLVKLLKFHDIEKLMFENVQKKNPSWIIFTAIQYMTGKKFDREVIVSIAPSLALKRM